MDHGEASRIFRREYPVFVLGSPRSGTSTIAHVIKEHFGYQGHAEGHVFNLMHKLVSATREHYVHAGIAPVERSANVAPGANSWLGSTTAATVSQARLTQQIIEVFKSSVAWVYGESWFDKTPGPEAIHAVEMLVEMYPRAKFVFLIREPISNIESRMRKFPNESFREHCLAWVESANAWLRVRSLIPEGSAVELRTHELTREPAKVYRQLLELLKDHPLGKLAAEKPPLEKFLLLERTNGGDPSAQRSLADVSWSEADKTTFISICGAVMDVFGFSATGGTDETDSVTLPPPYGQKNVEVKAGTYGGVWPEVRGDRLWVFLHPSTPGTGVTRITYRDVNMDGIVNLRSRITVTSELSQPVRFRIVICKGGEEVASLSRDCGPMEELGVEMPVAVSGRCDVHISTETAGDSVQNAWAMILPLKLERAKGGGSADFDRDAGVVSGGGGEGEVEGDGAVGEGGADGVECDGGAVAEFGEVTEEGVLRRAPAGSAGVS